MFNSQTDDHYEPENLDDAADDQGASTMPLLGSLASDEEGLDPLAYDSAEENKRIATQSAILIAIVALIAGGVLMGMRLTSGGSTAEGSTEQLTKIESFIQNAENPGAAGTANAASTNLSTMLADADKIVSKIATQYPEKAVPLEQVQKNPFELSFMQNSDEGAEVAVDFAERQRQDLLKAIGNEFEMLKLQSIMGSGRRSVAMIDDEFYRVGQRVGSFRVAGIQSGRVALVPVELEMRQGDPRFILNMQAEVSAGSHRNLR